MTINREHLATQKILDLILDECRYWQGRDEARRGSFAILYAAAKEIAAQAQAAPEAEPVAWDWYNARRYGAPGERRHNVLWVDDYRRADGTIHDLDYLLESYRQGGDSGGITLHLKPLHYAPQHDAELVELMKVARAELWQVKTGCHSAVEAGHVVERIDAKLASLRHV